jgi:hypothetical protein
MCAALALRPPTWGAALGDCAARLLLLPGGRRKTVDEGLEPPGPAIT